MTTDTFLQILQSVGYILLLVTIALLWRNAARQVEERRYWGLLAAARTLNLLANIAWIVHDFVTGTSLAKFSGIDSFYVLGYVLIGCALWLYPAPLSRRVWLWVGGAMLAMTVVIWSVYFNPTSLPGGGLIDFLGLAIYPVLDAGMVVLAGLRARAAQRSPWGRYSILLFCAVTSYGIANMINLTEYVFAPIFVGILAHGVWMVSTAFLLLMALQVNSRKESQSLVRNEG